MHHSQRPSTLEKRICTGEGGALGQARQSNRTSKGVRHPKEGNGNGRRGGRPSVASQPLCPGKSPMGSFGTRKRCERRRVSGEGWLSHADLHLLMAREGRKGAPMKAAAPVTPQDRLGGLLWYAGCGWWWGIRERMEDGTHARWPHSVRSVPLAWFASGTATAMANPGGIHHSQGSIVFKPSFLGVKRMVLWTAQRARHACGWK